MSEHERWGDVRAELVAGVGGEGPLGEIKQELLAQAVGQRLAQLRRSRGGVPDPGDAAGPGSREGERT